MATGIHTYTDVDLQDALVLVAFPTTGLVASIAAHYMTKQLSLPLVGSIHTDQSQPIAAVHDGIAATPLRIFGGEVTCTLTHSCPRVFLIATDIPVDPDHLPEVAHAIVEWSRAGGARLVLSLEGASVDGQTEGEPRVLAAAGDEATLKVLADAGVAAMTRGLLTGITGALLDPSINGGIAVGSIVVEASEIHPDARAAAQLIQAVDRFIPHVRVDTAPLLQEALELEDEVRRMQDRASRNKDDPHRFGTFI